MVLLIQGITVISVGIGDAVSFDELNTISSDPSSLVFHVDNFGALESIKSNIISVASRECTDKSECGHIHTNSTDISVHCIATVPVSDTIKTQTFGQPIHGPDSPKCKSESPADEQF